MTVSVTELAKEIQRLFAQNNDSERERERVRFIFEQLRSELSAGRVRAAEPDPSAPTGWKVNTWVKQGILLGFRAGKISVYPSTHKDMPYLDKDTLPL